MTVSAAVNSIELVQTEIESTIQQAEQNLERFQENRDSGEDLQNCIDFLNQLKGIFVLVEIRGGVMLAQEAVSVANEVPVGANDDKNNLLTALSNALFVLRRYIEYYNQKRQDHPELLLPIINELRQARNEKRFPDSHFIDIAIPHAINYCSVISVPDRDQAAHFELHSKRFRHMFQVALLGLIKEQNIDISLKLVDRAASGCARLCHGQALSQLWGLLQLVSQIMLEQGMEITDSRKRLMMKIERYLKEMVFVGTVVAAKSAPDSIFRELIYILFLSASDNERVQEILQAAGLQNNGVDEAFLKMHRKRLFGPGIDVLRSLSKALQEEILQLKDKLDIFERGIDPDSSDVSIIVQAFDRLVGTLTMLDLPNLGQLCQKQLEVARSWESGEHAGEDELLEMADAVLSIEQTIKQFEESGIAPDINVSSDSGEDENPYLSEAMIVVMDESYNGLALAKRSIIAFIESDWDRLHLSNIGSILDSIRGSMLLVNERHMAEVLVSCMDCINTELYENEDEPRQEVLETLADAITSLEYYIESLKRTDASNMDLLSLAEESLKSIGYTCA